MHPYLTEILSQFPAQAQTVSLQLSQHCRWNVRQAPLPQILLQLVPQLIGCHQIHQVAEARYDTPVHLQTHLSHRIALVFLVCIGKRPTSPKLNASLTFFYVEAFHVFGLSRFNIFCTSACRRMPTGPPLSMASARKSQLNIFSHLSI